MSQPSATEQLSLLKDRLDWSAWAARLSDPNLSDRALAEVPLLPGTHPDGVRAPVLCELFTLLWQALGRSQQVPVAVQDILRDYPFATAFLWSKAPEFSTIVDPSSPRAKASTTDVAIMVRVYSSRKWERRAWEPKMNVMLPPTGDFASRFTVDSVLRDCGIYRILAGLGMVGSSDIAPSGVLDAEPQTRAMIRALALALHPATVEIQARMPWNDIMKINHELTLHDVLYHPGSAPEWPFGPYACPCLRDTDKPAHLLTQPITDKNRHPPARIVVLRDEKTLQWRNPTADTKPVPVVTERIKRSRESTSVAVVAQPKRRSAQKKRLELAPIVMEVDDAPAPTCGTESLVTPAAATTSSTPSEQAFSDASQNPRLLELVQKQREFRKRFEELPIPKFDEKSACAVPDIIEMPFEHVRYGYVRILAELVYVDDETPDPIKRRPNNYERYYLKRDENNQVDKHLLTRARVGYFHIVRAVHPSNSPLAVFVDEMFSSFNVSAAALGNCDAGWKAWHLFGRPKYTMAHIASVNGFRNNLDLMRPFCPEERTDEAERRWMTVPRRQPDGTCKDSILSAVQKLRLARNIAPLATMQQPNPKPAYVWYIPYRDFFAAACRFECNEHLCSGGENDGAHYRCPHGYEHEPYEVNENPDDVPLFDVPKEAVMVEVGDTDTGVPAEEVDATTGRKRSSKSAVLAAAKRKMMKKYDGLAATKFGARIMFDRMDAHQLRVANHPDVQRIMRAHLDELRSKPSRFPLGMRPIPLRMIYEEQEWANMMRNYTPSVNQTKIVANGVWRPVTFRLNRRPELMDLFASQLETVTYQVLTTIAKGKLSNEDQLLDKCLHQMKL